MSLAVSGKRLQMEENRDVDRLLGQSRRQFRDSDEEGTVKQLDPFETHLGGKINRTKCDGWEEVPRVTESRVSDMSNLVNRGDIYKK